MDRIIELCFEAQLKLELEIKSDTEISIIKSNAWNLLIKPNYKCTIKCTTNTPNSDFIDLYKYLIPPNDQPIMFDDMKFTVQFTEDNLMTHLTHINDELYYDTTQCIKTNFVSKWRSTQKDSYNFIVNTLLSESYSGKYTQLTDFIIRPRPQFIGTLTVEWFTFIHEGIELFKEAMNASDDQIMFIQSWIGYDIVCCVIRNFNKFYLQLMEPKSEFGAVDIYKVKHNDPAIWSQFDELMTEHGHMGFHGSVVSNWYGILFNGLYVAKDKMILNGAAYGNGIYLSDTSSLSLSYCTKVATNKNIMGVFQVLKPLETFKKTSNIFVVPDEKLLCLRYILCINSKPNTQSLDKHFIKGEIVQTTRVATEKVVGTWSQVLMNEIRILNRRDGKMGDDGIRFFVELADSDKMNVIQFKITNEVFKGTNMEKDMADLNVEYIVVEMKFPQQYPFEPPFVRIVSPIFKYKTGHITVGGSICMELLTIGKWNPVLNPEKILQIVVQSMIDGDGRLEPGRQTEQYSLRDAETAFTRMIATHSEWK